MKKLQYADTVLAELTSVLAQVDDAQAEQLIEKICQAQTVFLAGSGRSGLAGKAFAMRLGHLGKQAAVIGETMSARAICFWPALAPARAARSSFWRRRPSACKETLRLSRSRRIPASAGSRTASLRSPRRRPR